VDLAILRQLATADRPLSHEAIDELPDTEPLKHLRAILVATGALPVRDEHVARLGQAVARAIGQRDAVRTSSGLVLLPDLDLFAASLPVSAWPPAGLLFCG
jgi:hypothetical protein